MPANGQVFICPGAYPEQVTITKNLNVSGVAVGNADQVVIAIPPGGIPPERPKGNATPVIEPNGVALPTISREDQERCEELLQRWMVALNSYDAAGIEIGDALPACAARREPRRNLPSRR
jgi:hypothetical protein